jgi:hypothetical protein
LALAKGLLVLNAMNEDIRHRLFGRYLSHLDKYWPGRVNSEKLTAKSREMMAIRLQESKYFPDAIDLNFKPCDWWISQNACGDERAVYLSLRGRT